MAKSVLVNSDSTLAEAHAWLDAQYAERGRFKLSASAGKRGLDENALSHVWYGQIAVYRQDVTPLYVKSECKLEMGIPILLRRGDEFTQLYNKLIRGKATYEEKITFMDTCDVTSIMDPQEMSEYLTQIQQRWQEKGLFLEGKSGQ